MTDVLGIRGTVITPREEIADGLVTIEAGKISHVGRWTEDRCEDLLDFSGCYVASGLVDIHVHGGGGHSAMDPEGIPRLSEFLILSPHHPHGPPRTDLGGRGGHRQGGTGGRRRCHPPGDPYGGAVHQPRDVRRPERGSCAPPGHR